MQLGVQCLLSWWGATRLSGLATGCDLSAKPLLLVALCVDYCREGDEAAVLRAPALCVPESRPDK